MAATGALRDRLRGESHDRRHRIDLLRPAWGLEVGTLGRTRFLRRVDSNPCGAFRNVGEPRPWWLRDPPDVTEAHKRHGKREKRHVNGLKRHGRRLKRHAKAKKRHAKAKKRNSKPKSVSPSSKSVTPTGKTSREGQKASREGQKASREGSRRHGKANAPLDLGIGMEVGRSPERRPTAG